MIAIISSRVDDCSPVESFNFPEPVHIHSLIPNMSMFYSRIFLATCADLHILYIVHRLQLLMRSISLGLRSDFLSRKASSVKLSPANVMLHW